MASQDAFIFLEKIYTITENSTERFQISTDEFKGYDHTVSEVLGTKVDYGQVVKIYGAPNPDEVKYLGSEVIEIKRKVVCSNPARDEISNSFVKRANLTMRISMRRLTRLTNVFSKK